MQWKFKRLFTRIMVSNYTWKRLFNLLCDLYSSNILIARSSCLITDLGLCESVDEGSSSTLPEVFQKRKKDKRVSIIKIAIRIF